MKKHISFFSSLFLCLSIFAQTPTDPTLMIINDEVITKSEFEYIYNKNNADNAIDKKDLKEYALLFSDLKIKVAEAKAKGLDTTAAFKEEFSGYRMQSAKQYLTDQNVEKKLIQEAYNRLKEEISVSHILIRIEGTDTLTAYKKALDVIKRLKKEDFAKVAKEVSDDKGTAEEGGYIGYVTGLQLILPFEEAMYALPIGKISQQPVRTRAGYHIIKVNNRRPSQGSVHAAHIMIMFPQNPTAEDEKNAKLAIDSIYNKLKAGADFAELARSTSQHTFSARNDGELGWFSTGRSGAGENFETAAFALKIGEFSAPVKSPYGYHIVKVLDRKPLASLDEKMEEIKSTFAADGRVAIPVREFKKNLRKEYNLRIIQPSLVELKNVAKGVETADSDFFEKVSKFNKPLFSFNAIVYNQQDYIDFLKKTNNRRPLDIDNSLYAFIDEKLYEYEDTQLEKKHTDFRLLMQEYHDGMLMFEITSNEVWEKAAEDTEGLKAFFEENQQNYTWDTPRFKGTMVYAKDKRTAKKAQKIIATAPADSIPTYLYKALNTNKERVVRTEKGLFIKGENAAVDKYVFNERAYSPTKEYPIVFAAQGGKILAIGPDDYRDMKGLVISDYQNYLQDKWMMELREKYPVVLFEDVLNSINN